MALGAHQDIQQKVVKELYDVFSGEDRNISPEDIQKLVYLECVIKETLRILPVVSYFARQSSKEIKLGIL